MRAARGPDPDLESLLLDTTRLLASDPRLYDVTATWLALYSCYVARKRLRVLARSLSEEERATLGLLVEEAIRLGARRDLRQATVDCNPLSPPRPLFLLYRRSSKLADLAKQEASEASHEWGQWAPSAQLKRDAIRPPEWILQRNPSFRWRAIRQGDLRESVLQTLQRDLPKGWSGSESELARRCGVTRPALRQALRSLELEGCKVEARERGPRSSKQLSLRHLTKDLA